MTKLIVAFRNFANAPKIVDSFNRNMLKFLRDKNVRAKRRMDKRDSVHSFVLHPCSIHSIIVLSLQMSHKQMNVSHSSYLQWAGQSGDSRNGFTELQYFRYLGLSSDDFFVH
jgi:hypothetical protein